MVLDVTPAWLEHESDRVLGEKEEVMKAWVLVRHV